MSMFTIAKVITPSDIGIIFFKDKVNYCLSERQLLICFSFQGTYSDKHFVVYGNLALKFVYRDKLGNSDKLYHSIFVYFY